MTTVVSSSSSFSESSSSFPSDKMEVVTSDTGTANIGPTGSASSVQSCHRPRPHTAVVLFYKYFSPSRYPLLHMHLRSNEGPSAAVSTNKTYYEEQLFQFQKALCTRLQLKGRIAISLEGINGTLSAADPSILKEYMARMESFELIRDVGFPPASLINFPENSTASEYPQHHKETEEKCDGRSSTANHKAKENATQDSSSSCSYYPHYLFSDIDWKESSLNSAGEDVEGEGTFILEPFPDLKISVVKEIISSGNNNNNSHSISVADLDTYGGRHLSPREFHQALLQHSDAVLIDVRNSFEYKIGHFIHPVTEQHAINPQTVNFSTFDSSFCSRQAEQLKDKKVLMYCTGGIRCEKASAMLRKRGITQDVSQLKGGIHRYLEEFGDQAFFHGLNFVFDQRVAVEPSECKLDHINNNKSISSDNTQQEQKQEVHDHERQPNDANNMNISDNGSSSSSKNNNGTRTSVGSFEQNHHHHQPQQKREILGTCIECGDFFDEYCGSRICSVCRDLVLVCPTCQRDLVEYHCERHSAWKHCYFTFLERFDVTELASQKEQLESFLLLGQRKEGGGNEPFIDTSTITATSSSKKQMKQASSKKVRKTLVRQIEKVSRRIHELEAGIVSVNREAPRRCRTCFESIDDGVCNGRCWGFWKTATTAALTTAGTARVASPSVTTTADPKCFPSVGQNNSTNIRVTRMIPLEVGDRVEPGPHWNSAILGSKTIIDKNHGRQLRRIGVVEELRSWGAGGVENDCAVVKWMMTDDNGPKDPNCDNEASSLPGMTATTKQRSRSQRKLYRWGVLTPIGVRLYDLQKVDDPKYE